jgi:hypothetical protein
MSPDWNEPLSPLPDVHGQLIGALEPKGIRFC